MIHEHIQGLDVTRFAAKQNLRPHAGRGAFARRIATSLCGMSGGFAYRNEKSVQLIAMSSKCPQWHVELDDPMHPGEGCA